MALTHRAGALQPHLSLSIGTRVLPKVVMETMPLAVVKHPVVLGLSCFPAGGVMSERHAAQATPTLNHSCGTAAEGRVRAGVGSVAGWVKELKRASIDVAGTMLLHYK